MLRMMVPPNTPIPACIQQILGRRPPHSLPHHTPHTLHAITFAMITPRQLPTYLHASTANKRCSAHICMLAAFSLPLLLTDNRWHRRASLPHPITLHAVTFVILTTTRPPNYLPASPGGDRRSAIIRVATASLRLNRKQL
jgi:hypothetical protein